MHIGGNSLESASIESIKMEHEPPDVSINCVIDTTAPCDFDCVSVYSMMLLPFIRGRESTTIKGTVLLSAADAVVLVKVMAAFGAEVSNSLSKCSTKFWVAIIPAVCTGRSEKTTVSFPIVARNL